jgi:hypothetical protein
MADKKQIVVNITKAGAERLGDAIKEAKPGMPAILELEDTELIFQIKENGQNQGN